MPRSLASYLGLKFRTEVNSAQGQPVLASTLCSEDILMLAALLLSIFTTVSSTAAALDTRAEPGGELKRGAFFGTKVNTVPDEVLERLKLDAGTGIEIGEIIPGSTAEAAGFKAGDVLVAVDGAKITGPGEFVRTISGRKAG